MEKVITEAGKKFVGACEKLLKGDLSVKDFQPAFDEIEERYYDDVSEWEDVNFVSELITANALYEPDPEIWEDGLYDDKQMLVRGKEVYTEYQRLSGKGAQDAS